MTNAFADSPYRVEEVFPEPVQLCPAGVVPVTPEGAESLARRPADNEVSLRVLRALFDIASEHFAAEVSLECLGGCEFVLHCIDGQVSEFSEMESETKAARTCEEINARDRPVSLCCLRVRKSLGCQILRLRPVLIGVLMHGLLSRQEATF